MKTLLKLLPPALLAVVGAITFAKLVGPGAFAPIILILSLAVLGFMTLMAASVLSGPPRSEGTESNRWFALSWLAAFWIIPVAGYLLIFPMAVGAKLAVAQKFPAAVQPRLERYLAVNGRYPADVSEVAFWDMRRHFLQYSSDGRYYSFRYRDPDEQSLRHTFSSETPTWTTQSEYDD